MQTLLDLLYGAVSGHLSKTLMLKIKGRSRIDSFFTNTLYILIILIFAFFAYYSNMLGVITSTVYFKDLNWVFIIGYTLGYTHPEKVIPFIRNFLSNKFSDVSKLLKEKEEEKYEEESPKKNRL